MALDCRLTLHHISHKILALNTRTIGIGGFFKKHRYQFLNFQHSRMDERLHMHEYFSSMFLAHVDNIGHCSARNGWMVLHILSLNQNKHLWTSIARHVIADLDGVIPTSTLCT